jgi:hypothetical protein
MKDIISLLSSPISEEIKLRALLIGLGTITKNYAKLGFNFFLEIIFRWLSRTAPVRKKSEDLQHLQKIY